MDQYNSNNNFNGGSSSNNNNNNNNNNFDDNSQYNGYDNNMNNQFNNNDNQYNNNNQYNQYDNNSGNNNNNNNNNSDNNYNNNFNNNNFIMNQLNDMLNRIDSSQDYIKNTKEWIMNNCFNSVVFVNFITKKVTEISPDQKLFILFLISDILHFSQFNRIEGRPEYFIQPFYQNLPMILSNTYYIINQPMRDQVNNILNLWIERNIYTKNEVEELKKYLKKSPPPGVAITPGVTVSHIRLSQDVTLPLNPQDIDYYHLYNFDRSENNTPLYNSIDHFYKTIYKETQ
ncbi:hypothetical protein ACTFIR_010576 [Dictyostelium discoideum]